MREPLRHLFSGSTPRVDTAPALEAYVRSYNDTPHLPGHLRVADLERHHGGFASSLHRGAQACEPDVSAFLYAALRLPDCVDQMDRVLIGPSEEVFAAAGHPDVAAWNRVQSRSRRRRYHLDGRGTLAVFATSLTDLDDLVPSLCAFQIEWNKMHRLLARGLPNAARAGADASAPASGEDLRHSLGLNRADWDLLRQVWDQDWTRKISAMSRAPLDLRIERLPLHARYFEEAAEQWWDLVSRRFDLDSATDRPIYLVSSNTHGLANLISGFAADHESDLAGFLRDEDPEGLDRTWREAVRDPDRNRSDLLYYALRHYLVRHPEANAARTACEESAGLSRFLPTQYPHLEAQKIELNRLDPARLDSRLSLPRALSRSRACILNLDYPLGLAAGHLLSDALRRFPRLRGVFILGKSAATIGRLGDILGPCEVHDRHTETRYRFPNRLGIRRLTPYLNRIAAFDDQKSVTVRGTFLHGRETSAPLIRDDFTGMEMEAGPYLNALYRHFAGCAPAPRAILDLPLPSGFSLGLLHYTSDTPYNVRPSLLSARLGLAGLEAAYASILAILQCILDLAAGEARSV